MFNAQNQVVQQANYPGYSFYDFAMGTNGQIYNSYSYGSSDSEYSAIILEASVMPDLSN